MGNYTSSDGFSKIYDTKDAVILSGASLSAVVDLEQLNITGFQLPASWTTAKLTFQASYDGVTFGDVQDSSGNELQVTVAAGKFIGVNLSELSGLRYLKVRSGTSSVPVNQGADRTISIVLTNNAEASAGASGGGGAATIADGADVAEGATTDSASTAGAAGTISAKLRRLTTDLDAVKTSVAAIPGSPATSGKQDTGNTSLASIDGKILAQVLVSTGIEKTRPADTTAYAALDAIAESTSAPTVFTFTGMGRANGGSGYITKAQIATDQKTNTARFRLHLFNSSPTAINDNSPYLSLYANVGSKIGVIDFPAVATEDATSSTQATAIATSGSGNIPLPFVCGGGTTSLYGILETLDAFTPASGQKITVTLTSDQN